MITSVAVAAGLLAAAAALLLFVALAEVSLATISRAHVRQLSEAGVPSARMVETLLKDAERFLAGILVLRTVAIGMAVAAATWLALRLEATPIGLIEVLLGVGIVLLLLQVGGRALAVQHPTGVALRVVWPLGWLLVLAAPLIWMLLRIAWKVGLKGAADARSVFLTEDGLRLLLNFGDEEQFIEADEREMIDSIFRFSETTVARVMVPRVDVVALEVMSTPPQALDIVVSAGHSRIPVYEETIDKIVGVLYAKDMLTAFRAGRMDFSMREVMRPPYFVPDSAIVSDLLGDLQHKKTHLAVVVDEYGGTAGIVTIEDLLEEIVGEIQDEYDSELPLLHEESPGVYLVSARIDMHELNRVLGLNLEADDESHTLAGIIYSHLQRVPDVGDLFTLENVRLEVVQVTENRIEQVRLSTRMPENAAEMPEDEQE